MIRSFSLGTVAVLGLALAACNKSSGTDGGNAMAINQAAYPGAAAANLNAMQAAPMSPQDFVSAVATSDAFEIQAAQTAKDKARNPDVKSFADMMIKDHTKSTNQLKSITSGMKPPLDAMPKLTPDLKSRLASLQGLSGHEFDAKYADQQVSVHEGALSLLQNYAANGSNAQLKDFANKTAGVVQKHLDAARALMTQ